MKKSVTIHDQAPEQFDDIRATTVKGIDHWTTDEKVGGRHVVSRPELTAEGLNVDRLEEERVTTTRILDGQTTAVTDNWRSKHS